MYGLSLNLNLAPNPLLNRNLHRTLNLRPEHRPLITRKCSGISHGDFRQGVQAIDSLPWKPAYRASSSLAYFANNTLRRSFMLTVISSAATENGWGTMTKHFICSQLATSLSAA